MNIKEHLLTCIIEECAEVQQSVSKALRFGLEDGYPGSDTTNAEDISIEVTELFAVIEMCRKRRIISPPAKSMTIFKSKQKRVKEYIEYAKTTGAITKGE